MTALTLRALKRVDSLRANEKSHEGPKSRTLVANSDCVDPYQPTNRRRN